MDEFEKIRAFSQELSRQTEQEVAKEEQELNPLAEASETPAEQNEDQTFLKEWSSSRPQTEVVQNKFSKTFWLVLSLTSLVLIGLIFVFWLVLHTPAEKGEIVSIAPTPTPVKVKPENPGGMVIPDQDKEIYLRLTKDTVPVKVEKLFDEEEEQPILPVVPEPTVVEEEVPVAPVKVVVEETVAPVSEPVPVVQKEVVVPKEPVKSAPKKEEVKVVAPSNQWKVQLFSSTDKVKVEKTWTRISRAHKKLLSNMPMTIEKAEISGKGTFYRLKVGEFSTKDRAENLCAKLKKQKQDCFPVK